MQRIWKQFTVLVAVFCLTLACAIFCACGSNKKTYTVKVVMPDAEETPVEGVELTFYDAEDESKVCGTIVTGADGKASGMFEEKNYRVAVTDGLPEGYGVTLADSALYTADWGGNSYLMTLIQTIATYTVSVTLPSGSGQSGVGVIFTPDSQTEQTIRETTDSNGTVSVRLSTQIRYLVTLDESTLPDNFKLSDADANGISTATGTSIKFRLVVPVTYNFVVSGPEGAPLGNISVSYAATPTGVRKPLGKTNESGKLSVKIAPTEGYAFITAPKGYAYNEDYSGNMYRLDSKIVTTFRLYVLEVLSLEDPMSKTQCEEFAQESQNSYFGTLMDEGLSSAYLVSKTFERANEIQLLSYTAQESGEYTLFVNYTNGNYDFSAYNSLNFKQLINTLKPNDPFKHFSILCEKGKTYYFSLKPGTDRQEVEFVIVSPKEKNEVSVKGEGTYELSVRENLPADIIFAPTLAGEYTFTVTGASHIQINVYSSNKFPLESSDTGVLNMELWKSTLYFDDGTPTNVWFLIRFTSTDENAVYPVSFDVRVTRTDIDEKEYKKVINHVEVTETLTQYADQAGTLTQIGVNGTNAKIVKGADGLYHYGSESGAVVVIKLKGPIDVFYPAEDGGNFELLDEFSSFYRFLVRTDETALCKYYDDYAKFLRGYVYFGEQNSASGEYYTKYVNSDGVYPLTDELIPFLKLVAQQNEKFFAYCIDYVYTKDSLWLFSAYTYVVADQNYPVLESDDFNIVGEGTESTPFNLELIGGKSQGSVTVNTQNLNGDDVLHCTFTTPADGDYRITLLNPDGEILFTETDVESNFNEEDYPYYIVKAGNTYHFTLGSMSQSAINYVVEFTRI